MQSTIEVSTLALALEEGQPRYLAALHGMIWPPTLCVAQHRNVRRASAVPALRV